MKSLHAVRVYALYHMFPRPVSTHGFIISPLPSPPPSPRLLAAASFLLSGGGVTEFPDGWRFVVRGVIYR